jgi:hypothetical protein
MVGVTWQRTVDGNGSSDDCENLPDEPAPTDGSDFFSLLEDDADSGQSDFRYSIEENLWQFSWQTPDVTGWHKLSISPPGGDVVGAWTCINLR